MTLEEVSNIRLINQKVVNTELNSVKEVIGWMGALQAQDYSMAKLAIGVRLLNSTHEKIETAFNNGEIIRTHLMRPTWHFVSADDIHWMLELTAEKIKSSVKSRHKELELSQTVIAKSNNIIEKALLRAKFLTREELATEMEKAGITLGNNRLSHLLFCAELDRIVCSGPLKGRKQTYALLRERVPNPITLSRGESLAKLAQRYFTAHGPATLHDFVWWSGLSVTEARQALESIKSTLGSETVDTLQYWFANTSPACNYHKPSVYLLPAFDEFLISYKDRRACLTLTDNKKAVSDNGIFRPVIVINGQVSGLWKPKIKSNEVIIETVFFQPQHKETKELVEKTAASFEPFFGKPIKTNFIDSL